MCPGIRPATGWIAYFTSTPSARVKIRHLAQRECCACATAMP